MVNYTKRDAQKADQHLRKMSGLRHASVELILAGILINLLALALPLSLLQMYDRIIPNQSLSTLSILILGVAGAILLETALRMLRSSVTGWLGARFEHRTVVSGLRHLSKVPVRLFMSKETGVYTEQLRSAGKVRDFYSGEALLVVLDLPFAIIFVGVIALIGGWLAAVVVVMIALFLAMITYFGADLRTKLRERSTQDDRRYNFLTETFRGIHSVKSMAMEPLMHRRYEMLQETNVNKSASVAEGSAEANNLGALFSQIMTVAIVAAGAYIATYSDITAGALAACIMLGNRSLAPLRKSLTTWIRYQSFNVSKDRLLELFQMATLPDRDEDPNFGSMNGSVDLRNIKVEFEGASSGPLFDNLNLSVRPGECVAIMGASGSGKTNLMNVIAGVIEPDEGEVLIDNTPIERIPLDELDQRIAHLPQHGRLINGTILENVTMFDEDLTEDALRACEAVALDRIVAGLRLGYETPIGDGSVETMPAGFRQRIAIAREILFEPRVILFDEANLAMDGDGEKALREYLEEKKGVATIILVTHRPSLIKLADSFYDLQGGRLVEGTMEDHIAKGREITANYETGARQNTKSEWALPDVVQHFPTPSDFALCLPALLAGLKWRGASRLVAESLPHLTNVLDLSGFRSIMANLGFSSESYKTRFQDIDPRLLPCLFVPEKSAAKVVVDHSLTEGFRFFDSEDVSMNSDTSFNEMGEAFVFSQVQKEEKKDTLEREEWTKSIILRFKGLMGVVFLLTVLSTMLSLATPLFVMGTFNFVLPTKDLDIAMWLCLGVLLAFGLDWLLKKLKNRIMHYMSGRSEFIIGNSIFQKVLNLPAPAIEKVPVGEQVTRVKDLEALRDFFVGPLATLAYELPASLIFVLALAIINPWMIVVVLFIAAAFAILGGLTFGPQARRTTRATRLRAHRDEFIDETLDNMVTLKSADATEKWMERFTEISGASTMAEYRASQFNERTSAASQAIATLGGVAAMTVASIAAMNQQLTGGAIIASMMIVWRLTTPIQNAFMSASTIIQIKNSLRQIDNLMNLNNEQNTEERKMIRASMQGALSCSRVSFRYSMNADPALLGVTFDVEPGEVIAIAGPNGSGKSSLLKLIIRAYDPQAGSIKLDGIDIRQIAPSRLREQISYMPQRCEIFYGTIAQNFRLVHPTATDDELIWAAKKASVYDEIMAMEQGSGDWRRTGFDCRISEVDDNKMPNGFRQKLGLARAYLKPAPVMLFDEPGNGLDATGDQAFVDAIQELRKHSTIFMVSHRPSHLKIADKVIYMEKGAIRAMGPFDNPNVNSLVMASLG